MSERKVLNKYYPPDFDPSRIPKARLGPDRQFVIRIMAPMNMRCNTCGEYIYKGKKFNARQETVKNETYLGLRIYRFYIKCPQCVSEITFKTDLENCDYQMEHGATRSFQAAYVAQKLQEKEEKEKELEEKSNPMQVLEKRTRESKLEMEALEKLEELKDMNKRHLSVDYESMIQRQQEMKKLLLAQQDDEEEENQMVQEFWRLKRKNHELEDDDDEEEEEDEPGLEDLNQPMPLKTETSDQHKSIDDPSQIEKNQSRWKFGLVQSNLASTIKKKKVEQSTNINSSKDNSKSQSPAKNPLFSMLEAYGDDDDDDNDQSS